MSYKMFENVKVEPPFEDISDLKVLGADKCKICVDLFLFTERMDLYSVYQTTVPNERADKIKNIKRLFINVFSLPNINKEGLLTNKFMTVKFKVISRDLIHATNKRPCSLEGFYISEYSKFSVLPERYEIEGTVGMSDDDIDNALKKLEKDILDTSKYPVYEELNATAFGVKYPTF